MKNCLIYQKQEDLKFAMIILLVLLATSGFPSFLGFKAVAVPLLLPVLFYKLSKIGEVIPKKVMIVLVVLFLFGILHFFIGDLTVIGLLSFMLTMITIIYAAIAIGNSFTQAFVKIMRFFSYIAVFVWILLLLAPSLHSTLLSIGSTLPQMMTDAWLDNTTNEGVSFYLYFLPSQVASWGVVRNCGPFFEPGLFASYLTIALVLNVSWNHKLLHRSNWVLIAAIFTTCSSAGYVSLAFIVLYAVFFSKSVLSKSIAALMIALLWQPMLQLDFMSEKIKSNFESANESSASRFGALIYHSEKIAESPFIGYAGGELPETNFDRMMGRANADRVLSPNGLSYPFVYWGVPLALCFYVILFRGIKKLVPKSVKGWELCFIYIVVLSAAFSQTITTEPVVLLMSALSFTE